MAETILFGRVQGIQDGKGSVQEKYHWRTREGDESSCPCLSPIIMTTSATEDLGPMTTLTTGLVF